MWIDYRLIGSFFATLSYLQFYLSLLLTFRYVFTCIVAYARYFLIIEIDWNDLATKLQ